MRFNAACLADTFPISESAPWPFQTRSIPLLNFSALGNWVPGALKKINKYVISETSLSRLDNQVHWYWRQRDAIPTMRLGVRL